MELENEICKKIIKGLIISGKENILLLGNANCLKESLLSRIHSLRICQLSNDAYASFIEERMDDTLVKYDYIIDMGLMASAGWPENLLQAVGLHLKENGIVIFVFGNIFHRSSWSIKGKNTLTCNQKNIYTGDAPRYFDENSVKIHFAEQLYENIKKYAEVCCSCDNTEVDDLKKYVGSVVDIAYYIYVASGFARETAWLQGAYTMEIRRQLAYMLQRIDFGIEKEHNAKLVWDFCRQNKVNVPYLMRMIKSATVKPDQVMEYLVTVFGGSVNARK